MDLIGGYVPQICPETDYQAMPDVCLERTVDRGLFFFF